MKAKLTNVQAQRLLSALRTIDQNDAVKLAGLTRLDIARNINRLMPHVSAVERIIQAKRMEISADGANARAIMAEMDEIGDKIEEYDLYEIEPEKLRLDDHPRITGDTIASLAPVLKDFDSMAAAK